MAHIDHGPMGAVDRRRQEFGKRVRELGDACPALVSLFPADQARILTEEIDALQKTGEPREWSMDDYLETLTTVLLFNRAAVPFGALRDGDGHAEALTDLAETDPRLLAGLAQTNPFGVLNRMDRSVIAGLLESDDRRVREAAVILLSRHGRAEGRGR